MAGLAAQRAPDPERPIVHGPRPILPVGAMRRALRRPRTRGLLLLLCALTTAGAAWEARNIAFDTSTEVWFLESDPDLLAYRRYLEVFGSDHLVVAAWEDPEALTPEGLRFVERVTAELEALPGVVSARSLTRATEAVAGPGWIRLAPLVDLDDPPAPDALLERVRGDPLYVGRLLSEDGLVPAVVLTMDVGLDLPREKERVVQALREATERLEADRGAEIHLAGTTMLDEAFFRYTRRDLLITFPAILLVITVVVLLLFRTWRALLLPTGVVLTASLWTAGLMGALDIRMTVIHSAIFPMLLGMGIANSMHLLSRTTEFRAQGLPGREAGLRALEILLLPSLLTALTSAAGLVSLTTAALKPLREMGVLAAFGVLGAFVLTYALGPLLLPLLPVPPHVAAADPEEQAVAWERWDAGLARLARAVQRRPGRVLAGAALLAGLSLLGLPRLHMGINILEYFKESADVRQEIAFVDRHLAGTLELEVLVDTGVPDGIKDPDVLRALTEVEAFLRTREGVGGTISPADYLRELRRVAKGGDPAERRLPASRAEASQLLLLLEDTDELDGLVTPDWSSARVGARIRASQVPALVRSLAPLDPLLEARFEPPVRASSTGLVKLVRNMETFLLTSQVRSLGTALLMVMALMVVALRSLRLGVFAMIPNVVPIAVVLGAMGWTGIPLDPGTSMTAAVAIGLVVDDTVHFLYHLRERLEAGDDVRAATEHTLVAAGRAAAMAAVILTLAFWVGCTASFKPNIYFGLLSGVTVLLAAAAELVLLPAALAIVPERWLRPRARRAAA